MPSLRALPFAAFVTVASVVALAALAGCSSSPAAPSDAGVIDAPMAPLFCGLPIPSICPATAPCSASAWGCVQTACEGYFVVTDGSWVYYYSLPGGELAGEIPAGADASLLSCPYGFQPPASCVPAVASQCSADGSAPLMDAASGE